MTAAAASRHPAARSWVFPPAGRPPPPPGLERTNLRELVARPARFEHHLVACAAVGAAQLEIVTASEPLYFAHINLSDELAVVLPTGDPLVDRAPPFRTFLSDPATGEDVGRYQHRALDLVLHPEGFLHWPGRLRPPYAPPSPPPGARRAALSLVLCATRPTRSSGQPLSVPVDRSADVKVYADPPPPMGLAPLGTTRGVLATIGDATLSLAEAPTQIAPSQGGWVVVLASAPGSAHAPCDLYRVPKGERLDGAGIVRALVLSSDASRPEPAPRSWSEAPLPAFAPFEDEAPGALPAEIDGVTVEERSGSFATLRVGERSADVPRYWLARMLFRVGLHRLRLGYVETYGGFFVDDRGDDPVRFGLREGAERAAVTIARERALSAAERLYRAVAPPGYLERLA